jgi:hypothetical protein
MDKRESLASKSIISNLKKIKDPQAVEVRVPDVHAGLAANLEFMVDI